MESTDRTPSEPDRQVAEPLGTPGEPGHGPAARRRYLVAAAAVALVGAVAAVVLWPDDTQEVTTAPSASAPSTTAPSTSEQSTDSSPTSEPTTRLFPRDLPPCGTPAPASYRTVSDWFPASSPDGLFPDWAHTVVNAVDPTAPGTPEVTFGLAAIGDGRLTNWVTLRRFGAAGFQVSPDQQPGFATDGAALDSVRGRPGRIVRTVNRGDPLGDVSARWIEGDVGWSASSVELGVSELADALAALDLTGSEPSDPTGRFQVVGRTEPAKVTESRDTTIEFGSEAVRRPSEEQPGAAVKVEIWSASPGSEGLATGPGAMPPGGWEVSTVDGRLALRSATQLLTSLADGSQVVLNALVQVDDQLEQLIAGLTAVEAGDDRLAELPVVPAFWEGTDGLCRE